jgi:putative transposase
MSLTRAASEVRPAVWDARAGRAIITVVKARRGAHTVYQLAYHFVWIPRYRRKVLGGDVGERLEELIREICAARGWEIEALAVGPDHVHLFASCPPREAPAKVMNVIKSLTARRLYAEFPQLRRSHWGGKLWSDGYYVGSAGDHVTSDQIKRYIEYQDAEDNGKNQLF